jgi:hypothetical protein
MEAEGNERIINLPERQRVGTIRALANRAAERVFEQNMGLVQLELADFVREYNLQCSENVSKYLYPK